MVNSSRFFKSYLVILVLLFGSHSFARLNEVDYYELEFYKKCTAPGKHFSKADFALMKSAKLAVDHEIAKGEFSPSQCINMAYLLAKKTELVLANLVDSDLDSLRGLTNLKTLEIRDSNISGQIFESLNLTNLEKLALFDSNLLTIEFVKTLTHLENFFLTRSDINIDLCVFQNNLALKTLFLRDVMGFTNTNCIKDHQNLETLALERSGWVDNDFAIRDLSFLASLLKLRTLTINFNSISDLNPIQNLKGLRNLSLTYNNITDLTPISNLPSLTDLALTGNSITDLTPLQNLIWLSKLRLDRNKIANIDILSGFLRLDFLDLTYNNELLSLAPIKYYKGTYLHFGSIDTRKLALIKTQSTCPTSSEVNKDIREFCRTYLNSTPDDIYPCLDEGTFYFKEYIYSNTSVGKDQVYAKCDTIRGGTKTILDNKFICVISEYQKKMVLCQGWKSCKNTSQIWTTDKSFTKVQSCH